MSKRETENSPQTVDSFVVEQVRRCCLLRDIEDTRRRLFIDRKRQIIARVVLGSPSRSRNILNKCLNTSSVSVKAIAQLTRVKITLI